MIMPPKICVGWLSDNLVSMQNRERRKEGATMLDLDQCIRERHSTRMFLSNRPVPRELMDEALTLAQCAPSNSNIQPWHMVFVSGPSRDRLVAALLDEARRRPPNIPPLPDSFVHFRRELGAQVYGAVGIGIQDKVGHDAAVLRNWDATGSFSARRWPALSACTGTSARRTPSAWGCTYKRCC